jgi:IclR family acetate operon transcriptional repressor
MDRAPMGNVERTGYVGARATVRADARLPIGGLDRYASTTLDKAFSLIDVLSASPQSLACICDRTGLNKTTVLRLLRIMEGKGFVARTGEGYALGRRFHEIASSFNPMPDLRSLCRPLLKDLQAKLGGSVHLGLYDGVVVCLDALPDAAAPLPDGMTIGARLEPHASALGKALLALLADGDIRRRYGSRALPARTAWTITDLHVLLQDLRRVRLHGVAFDAGEFSADSLCWAIALTDRQERPLCAVSVSYRRNGERPGDAAVRAELCAVRSRLGELLAMQDIHSPSMVGGNVS